MVDIIAEILRNELSVLNFADKTAGLVKTFIKQDVGGENKINKKIPIAININPTTCNPDELTDLIPDDNKMSIMYLEDNGTSLVQSTFRYKRYTSNLRLICWVYLKRINKDLTDANTIMANVLKTVTDKIVNQDFITGIRVKITGFPNKEDLFTKYDYNEKESQFMTFPYDAFGLDMEVTYNVVNSCVEEIILDPDDCL